MKLAELIRILDRIRQLYVAAGISGPGNDLGKLIKALTPHSNQEFDAVLTTARMGFAKKARKKRSLLKNKTPDERALNLEAISTYVAALKQANEDQAAFQTLLDKIKADRSLKLEEVTDIAHRYSGGVAKFRSFSAAYTELSKAFIRHARFINKLR